MANPFAGSRWFHRLSNAFMPAAFRTLPVPRGFTLLTVIGRRSGKPRSRPVRAVRAGSTLYAVAILGERSDWLRNARKHPQVQARLGRRTFSATLRTISDPEEARSAGETYVQTIVPYDYIDHPTVEWDVPLPQRIRRAHQRWLDRGVLVAIDLA